MLKETGRVVAVEDAAIWVETIEKSTCGQCKASTGCGHSLLYKAGQTPGYLRVLKNKLSSRQYRINDKVTIGIPNDVIVKGSLISYLIPLLFIFVFLGIAHTLTLTNLMSVIVGILGLVSGGIFVRWYSYYHRNNQHYQPVVIDDELQTLNI